MTERIVNARRKDDSDLPDDQTSALNKLVQPEMLTRWADATSIPYDGSTESIAGVQAARVEQIGIQMLEGDPRCVVNLAPLQPGVENFFRMISINVPIAIASGTRKATIGALLDAHAQTGHPFLKDRVGTLIVSEEDSQTPKPERIFYDNALCSIGSILHSEGRILKGGMSVRDMLFIGDRVASGFDAPLTRKGMDDMIINAGAPTSLGPKIAVLSNFPSLITQLRASLKNHNPVIQKLARTITI